MVLLGNLDLVSCTEHIRNIPISDTQKISRSEGAKRRPKTHISEYKNRSSDFKSYSLQQYFLATNNTNPNRKMVFPHYVGVNGTPKYPVTDDYARHTLIVHKPWREYPKNIDWVGEFEIFINSSECPMTARLSYLRVMRRYIDKMTGYEPTASDGDHHNNPIHPDDEDVLILCGLKNPDVYDHDDALFKTMNKGIHYKWDQPPKVSYP